MNSDLLARITSHPEICHSKPYIRGMRWPVEVIIDLLGSGMSVDEIIEDHPELEKEDIFASLQFAKLVLSGNSLLDLAS
ncbi:DUF433 domain-containing protein [Algoriphagus hitonicola]|uniref:Uncharacterized conserved protein, DUF433 family n=1 Tax=Algoriphagus hitonicola TaxID=435880 RepID=A0A1I2NJB4_9BACT|nr:DUF433 domain-containing protein [Algoriphagus hitonicola]SFG03902.1 Uncharacterized conserved protein, DUF433 family [Algoriphagus hitonicola]